MVKNIWQIDYLTDITDLYGYLINQRNLSVYDFAPRVRLKATLRNTNVGKTKSE